MDANPLTGNADYFLNFEKIGTTQDNPPAFFT